MTDLMSDAERTAWTEGLSRILTESGGALAVMIVRPPDAPALFEAAQAGDREAARMARAVAAFVERVNGAEPTLCATCDADLADTPFSVAVVLPSCDDPTKGVAVGVCAECASGRDAILGKAIEALRQVLPDIRHIEMQGHAAGHA
jgi:hypothetical protein